VLYLTHRHLASYTEASTGLSEELPKNGDVPKSPLSAIGNLNAAGRHDFNLKIEVVQTNGAIGDSIHGWGLREVTQSAPSISWLRFEPPGFRFISRPQAPAFPMRRLTLITIGGGLGR
jgi:hypothetical protein